MEFIKQARWRIAVAVLTLAGLVAAAGTPTNWG